jgi:hypothetical protein
LKLISAIVLSCLVTFGLISGQSQQPNETPEKPCSAQPRLAGKCFTVRGRLSLYNGTPTIRLWRAGTRRMLGISSSYAEPGYSSLPPEIERQLNWETDVWGDFRVCPFTRQRPGHMQLICIESGKNLAARKRP